ncbi:peptidoglycan recognition family protein [Acidaminococcus fermentans]|uniref:N-acetylmuramoyl-L-alanine amidase n=1 Tax=Acidaminococcus fermentans TaxID=905 RepID=UPI002431850A|nr:peptidoglycan recognition family protein [Acidaminococcus fermentans]
MNKKKRAGQALALAGVLVLASCPGSPVQGKYAGAEPSARAARVQETITPARPAIVVRPLAFTDLRRRLMRDYARIHYGREMETIVPQAVVVHWAASNSRDGVYRYFYNEENPRLKNGTLNVASHYLVDRDGTIWQLTPETALNRHAIGLNWCSIGIENVGGVEGREDLTQAQMEANVRLIRYLRGKYPTIQWVLGHYQQDLARHTSLWKENISGYYHGKTDPGPRFMGGLKARLAGEGVKFF